jgi:hypothetical protein
MYLVVAVIQFFIYGGSFSKSGFGQLMCPVKFPIYSATYQPDDKT